jgi:hypothetical protein
VRTRAVPDARDSYLLAENDLTGGEPQPIEVRLYSTDRILLEQRAKQVARLQRLRRKAEARGCVRMDVDVERRNRGPARGDWNRHRSDPRRRWSTLCRRSRSRATSICAGRAAAESAARGELAEARHIVWLLGGGVAAPLAARRAQKVAAVDVQRYERLVAAVGDGVDDVGRVRHDLAGAHASSRELDQAVAARSRRS